MSTLAAAILAFFQATNPSQQMTEGPCSPIVSGNNNTITVTCQDKRLLESIRAIVTKVATRQLDPEVVNSKLDEILKGVSDIRQSVATLQTLSEKDAPWILSKDQGQRLASALKSSGRIFNVPIWNSPTDLRSKEFADQISAAITSSGWSATAVRHILMQDAAGVFIAVRDSTKPAPEGAIILQNALDAAGIPSSGISVNGINEGAFELYIGQKPNPKPKDDN